MEAMPQCRLQTLSDSCKTGRAIMFGEFLNVRLSPMEHQKLLSRYGEAVTADYIERLSCWLKNTRKRRTSHYACLLQWIRKDKTIEIRSAPPLAPAFDEGELLIKARAIVREHERMGLPPVTVEAVMERLRGEG